MSLTLDRSASELWLEHSILGGLLIGAIGFGAYATLFFITFQTLWHQRKTRQNQVFLAYISIVFILANIANAADLISVGPETFIDNQGFPGGPGAYYLQSTDVHVVMCNVFYIIISWFQDGLMLFRFWVIFGGYWVVLIFPCIMFTGYLVISCILIAMLSRPTETLWTNISYKLSLAYWSLSISFNIILTIFICGRLLYMRYKLNKVMGSNSHSSPYTSISAILIESALAYSSVGLIFLVSYGVGTPIQNLALPVLGTLESIAPLLIILRVAQGKATTRTMTVDTMMFRNDGTDSSGRTLPRGSSRGSNPHNNSSLELGVRRKNKEMGDDGALVTVVSDFRAATVTNSSEV